MRADVVRRHEGSCKEKEAHKIKLQKMKSEGGQSSGGNTTNIYNITNNITNNTMNNTTNNTTNVQLRAFGDENLEYMTPDVLLGIFNRVVCPFIGDKEKQRFIGIVFKEIFANKKHPENHNMMIRSLKGSTAKVWNGEEFEERHRKDVEKEALTTIANVTSTNYYSEPEKFDENHNRFFDRYIGGVEAIDNGTAKEMTKNRMTVAYASHNSKPLVNKTQKELTRINLTENIGTANE